MRRLALLALAAGLAAGCSSASGSGGQATVWITHGRGAQVLRSARVPAGLTAMQALERVAKVKTRYGGRYVQSVDGLAESGRHGWFYYVNGYLADRGAAEYRLRAGDVEWWDYRGWRDPQDDEVVVGAFPEPFLHGYDGNRREAVVLARDGALGRRLARLIHGRYLRPPARAPAGVNVLEVIPGVRPRFFARLPATPGAPVSFVVEASFARRLLREPGRARHRYVVP